MAGRVKVRIGVGVGWGGRVIIRVGVRTSDMVLVSGKEGLTVWGRGVLQVRVDVSVRKRVRLESICEGVGVDWKGGLEYQIDGN